MKATRTLTLRLTTADAAAVDRLCEVVGEKTASKALIVAAKQYPALARETRALRETERKYHVVRDSLRNALGLPTLG